MRRLLEATEEILSGIREAITELEPSQVDDLLEALLQAREQGSKVLVMGAGRSGLVGRAFAMRLMHLGIDVYVMGETITPAVGEGDIVLIISGSGFTQLPVTVGNMAKSLGSKVLAVTSHKHSPLGKIADKVMIVSGRENRAREEDYHSRQLLGEHESLAPLGTMFEDSCMVILDGFIAELKEKLGVEVDEMRRVHAVIE